VNRKGVGSFAGLPSLPSVVQFEFRRAFESARDGASYSGDPFDAPSIGPVSVLAEPVTDEDGLIGVVEALVSWEPIRREFADEARRDVRATLVDRHGRVLFPIRPAGGERRHSSSLVADFERFPARVTRSETQPGLSVLASIAPVGRPEWGVLLERDLAAAFASVDRMVDDTLLWSAAALAGALLLGLFSARRLSRPITQLAENVSRPVSPSDSTDSPSANWSPVTRPLRYQSSTTCRQHGVAATAEWAEASATNSVRAVARCRKTGIRLS